MQEAISRGLHFIFTIVFAMILMIALFWGIDKGINYYSQYIGSQANTASGLVTGQNNAQNKFKKSNNDLQNKVNSISNTSIGAVNKISHSKAINNVTKNCDQAKNYVKTNGNKAIHIANKIAK